MTFERRRRRLPSLLPVLLLLTQQCILHIHALTTAVKSKGCRVCTSSTCSNNGSTILLNAMQLVSLPPFQIVEAPCLGGCCQGVVVRSMSLNARRKILKGILENEEAAVDLAQDLLTELGGLDEAALESIKTRLDNGERVLCNSEPPEVCQNCGVSLQLYRGNCAKCGKYPY